MRRCGSLLIVVAMFFLPATLARAQDQKQQATDVETILQETNARQLRRDFAIAEFYRRTGHPDSAFFYYKLIRKRYPNTEIAKNAAERIVELVDGGFVQGSGSTVKPPKAVEAPINDPSVSQEISKLREQVKSLEKRIAALESKPSAVRIGEIIVVGNTKTPTPDILKHIALYPGEVLQYARLAAVR